MECFVLGTGGMMPMPGRRLTSVAARVEGWVYLFDCGEGTQVPYKQAHLGLRPLRVVAVSHLHADHCLGLPGMLMLRAQMPQPEPLVVLGPPGLRRFIDHVRADLAMFINYEIQVREWSAQSADPLAYEDELVRLSWRPLDHSVLCLGYRLEEHDRPGRFDPQAASALGVPWGPLRGKLQGGQPVILPDGRTVTPEQVLGVRRRGRHLAFVTDTGLAPSLAPLLQRADVAFLESMFLPEHQEEARQKRHLTVEQAVGQAHQAGVGQLVLVHLSPRYDRRDAARMNAIAQHLHPGARVGRDGESFSVPLPD